MLSMILVKKCLQTGIAYGWLRLCSGGPGLGYVIRTRPIRRTAALAGMTDNLALTGHIDNTLNSAHG
jgi:hypothetical protein